MLISLFCARGSLSLIGKLLWVVEWTQPQAALPGQTGQLFHSLFWLLLSSAVAWDQVNPPPLLPPHSKADAHNSSSEDAKNDKYFPVLNNKDPHHCSQRGLSQAPFGFITHGR